MYKPEDYTKVEQEILAAIGELIIAKLEGHDDIAYAIFNILVPKYVGHYPHHKMLTHLVLQHVKDESDTPIVTRGIVDNFDN